MVHTHDAHTGRDVHAGLPIRLLTHAEPCYRIDSIDGGGEATEWSERHIVGQMLMSFTADHHGLTIRP